MRDNGLTRADEQFFFAPLAGYDCVLGVDYYALNEHLLHPGGSTGPSGEVLGLHAVARQYYERYGLPLMHTETNRKEEEGAAEWLHKQWHAWMGLAREGVPVVGFTWFSLTDQMDWDTALREDARRVNSVGLYDLDRKMRPAGREFLRLVKTWDRALNAAAPAPRLAAQSRAA